MKRAVAQFAMHIENDLFALHAELRSGSYRHGPYEQFIVHDPKRRWINKASVRDRIVHQAIVQVIEPIFERTFIFDSYSSRIGKGTHACRERMAQFLRQASANNRQNAWVLQCDIRRFFDSVQHDALLTLLAERVRNPKLSALLEIVVRSFTPIAGAGRGLPLGNVTSQLFGNVYLNGLDHFVKERLRMRWYVRFCDDFIIVHRNRIELEDALPRIRTFLADERSLELHPSKVTIRKYSYGIDCVGQVLRSQVRTLRRATIRRAFRLIRLRTEDYRMGRLSDSQYRSTLQSLLGLCAHGSNNRMRQRMREIVWRMLRTWK
ncbi:group II intron reverse transcriptase domain-containing protein [Candidatus Uhrbacteria bacterium]|nr:group II intron reverse transcriptase domain-containing protein [Candidatus Uhrbacteria bacterium]